MFKRKNNNNFYVFLWCIKIAWNMSAFSLCLWIGISILLAFLPALALVFQRAVLENMTG